MSCPILIEKCILFATSDIVPLFLFTLKSYHSAMLNYFLHENLLIILNIIISKYTYLIILIINYYNNLINLKRKGIKYFLRKLPLWIFFISYHIKELLRQHVHMHIS